MHGHPIFGKALNHIIPVRPDPLQQTGTHTGVLSCLSLTGHEIHTWLSFHISSLSSSLDCDLRLDDER
jgi:hypothetical protein